MLENIFANPSDVYRGTDFWMLNDTLDEDELRRQMRSMRAQGIASVIARTYLGLKSDYPGKDWMNKMHIVVDEAKKLGMTIFMQAGYMPEAVLDLPPEYSICDLRAYPAGQSVGTVVDKFEGFEYGITRSMTILDMLNPEACRFYVKQSYENMWQDFRNEYGKTIRSVWVDEPSFLKTTIPWSDNLPKAYAEIWNEEFPMEKIHLLFVDGEGDRIFRLRYWRTVLYLMKNAYFKSICDWGKANGVGISGHLMREDKMEDQISATCFTMPMYKYFSVPGIDYLTCEMDWVHGEIKPGTPYDKQWKYFGCYNTPLQCSSAAHQNGQKVVLAEMYGLTTDNLGFRDQKRMFDHFASLGINHRSVHGIFYSLRGRGKRAYPPHVNEYQGYWPKYHLLTDTIARETVFVRSGKPVRDIVLIHPIETAFSLYHGKHAGAIDQNKELSRLDESFNETIRLLVSMQANFELGDEDTINECGSVSENGEFVIGEMSYKTVILPNMAFVRESTLEILRKFQSKGGHVIVWGNTPSFTDKGNQLEFSTPYIARTSRELSDILDNEPHNYRFIRRNDDTGIQVYFSRYEDDMLFFITNEDCRRSASGTLVVPGEWKCERFCEYDGSICTWPSSVNAGFSNVPVDLPEGGTLMLRMTAGKPALPVVEEDYICKSVRQQWKVTRKDPNVLVLEYFRFAREGENLSDKTYPIIAIQEILEKGSQYTSSGLIEGSPYAGEITLETSFRLNKPISRLRLALEYPELQRLELDGKPLGNTSTGRYVCFGFETIDLPALDSGMHTLTIHRHFEPIRKPKSAVTSLFENLGGVELEPIMLVGEFGVFSMVEPGISGVIRLSDDFVIDSEVSVCHEELVTQGYPFYNGVMELQTEIEIPNDVKCAYLSFDGMHAAVAEVLVNGVTCGELCWPPYHVPLTDLKAGNNSLVIRLYSTIKNLLGPWHRPVGEIGGGWGGYDSPNQPWEGCFAPENGHRYPDWYADREPDREGWTEAYLFLPFGITAPKVHYIK